MTDEELNTLRQARKEEEWLASIMAESCNQNQNHNCPFTHIECPIMALKCADVTTGDWMLAAREATK